MIDLDVVEGLRRLLERNARYVASRGIHTSESPGRRSLRSWCPNAGAYPADGAAGSLWYD